MPKMIPAPAQTKIDTALGTEPISIVEIRWYKNGPSFWYADKDIQGAEGKILSLAGLDSIIKFKTGGAAGSIGVVLDDTDSSLKQVLDQSDVHKTFAAIYQTFEYDDPADAFNNKFLLFSGEVSTPLTWDEGERKLALEIVTKIEDSEIGFSPEQGAFPNMADSAVGKAWPLCFGSPLRVPAVKVTEQTRGTSLTRYGLISRTEADELCNKSIRYAAALRAKTSYVDEQKAVRLAIVKAVQDGDDDAKAAAEAELLSDEDYSDGLSDLIKAITIAYVDLLNYQEELTTLSPELEDAISSYSDLCVELNDAETDLAAKQLSLEEAQASVIDLEAEEADAQFEADRLYQELQADPQNQAIQQQYNDASAALQAILAKKQTAEASVTTLTTQVSSAQTLVNQLTSDKNASKGNLIELKLTTIVVDGGEKFPQNETIKIIVKGMKFEGQFNGRVFTISDSDLPTYENIKLDARQKETPNLLWLKESDTIIKGHYALLRQGGFAGPKYKLIYINNQGSTRCAFSPVIWRVNGDDDFDYYLPDSSNGIIQETAPIYLKRWESLFGEQDYLNGVENLPDNDWGIDLGDTVYLEQDYTDTYVANLIPSTVIKEVLAYRTINGQRLLQPVPTSYYSIHKNNDPNNLILLAGQKPTIIYLRRPLSEYQGENWADDLYVTLTSSEGANTADIIKYLIETYSNLTVDTSSFSSVATQLTKYPSHFAILERKNLLDTIEDIAWQARCAVWIKNEVVYIKYLSVEEAGISSISETDIDFGTLQITFSKTEDLVTRMIGTWQKEYTQEELYQYVQRNNIGKYGDIEKTFNFWIYNIESLVAKSLQFWLIRYSNTWKYIKFSTPLHQLQLETWDAVNISFIEPLVAIGTVKGVVENSTFDSENYKIDFEVWTAVRSGEMEQYALAFPATSTAGIQYPTPTDLYAGGESDGELIQASVVYDDNSRPKDLGPRLPSDSDDTTPDDPSSGREEKNYNIPDQNRRTAATPLEIDIRSTRIVDSVRGTQTTMDTMVDIVDNVDKNKVLSLRTDANLTGTSGGEQRQGPFGHKYDTDAKKWRPEATFLKHD